MCRLIEREYGAEGMKCLSLVLGGARRVHKAGIPTANYSSALFPSSKATSAALFPMIDHRDQLLKPAILVLIEEVLGCGVDEVLVIVSPHDLAAFRSLFHEALPREQREKLSPALQTYSERILAMGRSVRFVVQREQLGLGHAVYTARQHIAADEKFLLLLGDHL